MAFEHERLWRRGIGANWRHEGNWQRGKGLQLNGPKAWKSACDIGHMICLTDKMGIFPTVNIINKQRNRKSPSSPWTYSSYLLKRIVPKWIYNILKIFSQFTIFEQLPLALKFFTVVNILFIFRIFNNLCLPYSRFLSNCACPENRVALKFFTRLNILFKFRSFEQLALALKNRVALEFFTVSKYIS